MSRIKEARLNAIFDSYEAGERSPKNLLKAAKNAQKETAFKIGAESEMNFRKYASRLAVIKAVRHSSERADTKGKIDYWVTVDWEKYTSLPIVLPVQIKSNDDQVRDFKNSDRYHKFQGKILVLNTNPMFVQSMTNFKDIFFPELTRVLKILRPRP